MTVNIKNRGQEILPSVFYIQLLYFNLIGTIDRISDLFDDFRASSDGSTAVIDSDKLVIKPGFMAAQVGVDG